jgi:hypothetical protein
MSYYEEVRSGKRFPRWLKVTAVLGIVLSAVLIPVLVVSSNGKDTDDIPPIKPPVSDAAPNGLKDVSRRILRELQTDFSFHGQVRDRFFSGTGPTSIYDMLGRVDIRTREINQRATSIKDRPCMASTPVQVDINGWPGESLKAWIQCYEQLSETLFIMFGMKDDILYLYESDQMVTIMAYVHLLPRDNTSNEYPCCYQINGGGNDCSCVDGECKLGDTIDGGNCRTIPESWPTSTFNSSFLQENPSTALEQVDVDIYFSVGAAYIVNQTGSRGLMHLVANPKAGRIQATAAGLGLGFCGVELASDGSNLYIKGSQDGVGGTCEAVDDICVSGDLENELSGNECDGIVSSIGLLGRKSTSNYKGNLDISSWHESEYPGGVLNNVDIDNGISFGPRTIPSVLGRNHKF